MIRRKLKELRSFFGRFFGRFAILLQLFQRQAIAECVGNSLERRN